MPFAADRLLPLREPVVPGQLSPDTASSRDVTFDSAKGPVLGIFCPGDHCHRVHLCHRVLCPRRPSILVLKRGGNSNYVIVVPALPV